MVRFAVVTRQAAAMHWARARLDLAQCSVVASRRQAQALQRRRQFRRLLPLLRQNGKRCAAMGGR